LKRLEKIVLSTGGTGGHIFPALALAQEIKAKYPECEIVFMGGKYGPEGKIVQEKGFAFRGLPVRGIMGRGIKGIVQLTGLGLALVQSIYWLKKIKPQVVVGFGSYAGFAPVYAAHILRLKRAIHEQNSFPGLTNRLLARKVNRVFLSFPDEFGIFPKDRTVLTGNPIRQEIKKVSFKEDFSSKNLLILGGSQGATVLNKVVVKYLKEFKKQKINIWHQTGPRDYEWVKKEYVNIYPEAKVEAFIDNMTEAYSFADLVFCRAGASTIAELCAVKRPSILVPYPYAAYDHQLKNAQALEKIGAALVVLQPYLQEINFASLVIDYLESPAKLRQMAENSLKLGENRASEKILEEIEGLIQGD